jgi:uncharacterized protein
MNRQEKYENLQNYLRNLGSLAIAYSGGVDSTFLLKVAYEVLGSKCMAITARSSTYPQRELNEAIKYAKELGVHHVIIDSEELEIEGFASNPVNRCYFCKKELFSKVWKVAREAGIENIADGSNFDDLGDFRPGMEAARELKVCSPLKDCQMTKEDIRYFSKELGLPTWDKPSFACLSSRFPYGQTITADKLSMVEKAEDYLRSLGFRQVRVRHHGDIARIEVDRQEREKLFSNEMMDKVGKALKEIGFPYVTMDLLGYRTGSMNETI